MKSLWMEDLSWTEIREAMEQGADTVLICASSHEQHGPHLPESTDHIIGRLTCEGVAQRLGNTLIAPVIRPGLSVHHMDHPGSITLRPEVFQGLLEDYVSAYVRHGFRRIVLLSSHGGNFAAIHRLVEQLDGAYPGVRVIDALDMAAYLDICSQADRMYGYEEGVCGGHACCFETSILLYACPELVDMSQAVPGCVSADRDGLAQRLFSEGMTQVSPCGILGDPTDASPEKGRVFLEMLVDRTCRAIQEKLL